MAALSRRHTVGIVATVCSLAVLITGMVLGGKSRWDTATPATRALYPVEYHLDGDTILRRLDVWGHSHCADIAADNHSAAVAPGCRYAVEAAYEHPASDQRVHQLVLVYGKVKRASQVKDRFADRAVAPRFAFAAATPDVVDARLDAVGTHVVVTAFDGDSDAPWQLAFHDDSIERLRRN